MFCVIREADVFQSNLINVSICFARAIYHSVYGFALCGLYGKLLSLIPATPKVFHKV